MSDPRGSLPDAMETAIRRVREEQLTYLSEERLRRLAELCLAGCDNGVEGVLVETGCALGGSSIVLAAAKEQDRPLWIYDVFGMIPPPSDKDGEDVHLRYQTIREGKSEGIGGDPYYGYLGDLRGKVAASFRELGYPLETNAVTLVQGLLQESLAIVRPVSLAHIDVDWYDSVRTSLERIEPWLSPGGAIVIDDYADWSGCRRASDEYFSRLRGGYRFDGSAGSLVVVKEGRASGARQGS